MRRNQFIIPALTVGAAVVLVAGGTRAVQVLTLSSATTTAKIHACRKDSNGELFLWPTCPLGYTAYEWDVTGPTGPAGLPGPRGLTGTSAELPGTIALNGTSTPAPFPMAALRGHVRPRPRPRGPDPDPAPDPDTDHAHAHAHHARARADHAHARVTRTTAPNDPRLRLWANPLHLKHPLPGGSVGDRERSSRSTASAMNLARQPSQPGLARWSSHL